MDRTPRKVLCIGRDATLIELRCAVLAQAGYEACSATLSEYSQKLRNGNFDLVIVSERFVADQSDKFYAALPAETPTVVVDGLLFPADLLSAVAGRLQAAGIEMPGRAQQTNKISE
jgi:hypothetical protein